MQLRILLLMGLLALTTAAARDYDHPFSGKTATIWNWDSRKTVDGKRRSVAQERVAGNVVQPGEPFPEPELWFHDLFRFDGAPCPH